MATMTGRRMGWRSFKGPNFPSYQIAKLDTDRKLQWHAHCGTRAQLRNLRQKCRHILDAKDDETKLMGQRVIEAVKDEPKPEFGALHLIAAALDIANDTDVTWLDAMQYLLDKFEERQHEQRIPDGTIDDGSDLPPSTK
jgi:hypothetical protein